MLIFDSVKLSKVIALNPKKPELVYYKQAACNIDMKQGILGFMSIFTLTRDFGAGNLEV